MNDIPTDKRPTIFVSHAACDKKAVNLLTEWISGVGRGKVDVFCTSTPGSDIPGGSGFFQYIKDFLKRSELVVHFISPAFLRSEFCMLELGAAWAQDKSFPSMKASMPQSWLVEESLTSQPRRTASQPAVLVLGWMILKSRLICTYPGISCGKSPGTSERLPLTSA